MKKQKVRSRGRPAGGLSLVTVSMEDLMSVFNSKAKIVVGRVFVEQSGLLEAAQKKVRADIFEEATSPYVTD